MGEKIKKLVTLILCAMMALSIVCIPDMKLKAAEETVTIQFYQNQMEPIANSKYQRTYPFAVEIRNNTDKTICFDLYSVTAQESNCNLLGSNDETYIVAAGETFTLYYSLSVIPEGNYFADAADYHINASVSGHSIEDEAITYYSKSTTEAEAFLIHFDEVEEIPGDMPSSFDYDYESIVVRPNFVGEVVPGEDCTVDLSLTNNYNRTISNYRISAYESVDGAVKNLSRCYVETELPPINPGETKVVRIKFIAPRKDDFKLYFEFDGLEDTTRFISGTYISTYEYGFNEYNYTMLSAVIEPESGIAVGKDNNFKITVYNSSDKDITINDYAANYQSIEQLKKSFKEEKDYADDFSVKTVEGKDAIGEVIPAGGSAVFYGSVKIEGWNRIMDEEYEEYGEVTDSVFVSFDGSDVTGAKYGAYDCIWPDTACQIPIKDSPIKKVEVVNENFYEDVLGDDVTDYSATAEVKSVSTDAVLAATKNSKDTVVNVADGKVSSVTVMDKKYNVAACIDISIMKINYTTGEKTKVSETNKKIKFTFELPEEYKNSNKKFVVLRVHDGHVEVLEDIDNNPNTITIETDKFSVYMLAEDVGTSTSAKEAEITTLETKKDTSKVDSVETGDEMPIVLIAMIMVASIGCMIILKKKSRI